MKTLKLFIFLITGCAFLSCSKSVYYAWSSPKGDYCTLEVKKYEVIYRASASCYRINNNIYIFINDTNFKGSSMDNRSDNSFVINFNNLVGVFKIGIPESQKEHFVPSLIFITEGVNLFNPYENSRYLFYTKSENQDTIRLSSYSVIEYNKYDDFSNVIDPLLQKEGVTCFPNEMYRVKKINYKKFPESIQKMKLKNPY